MPDAPVTYTKLPGRGLRRMGVIAASATRCRLWLGVDHLLAVDYSIASEEYRRFYFRDIEVIVVRRTARRQVWNWVLLLLMVITAGPFVLAWRSEGSGGLLITAISVATFWGIFLLVNTLRGATCETHVRTAVQMEQLPSLGRLPTARKVLARLQPLIVAAQGAATPEELVGAPWMSQVSTGWRGQVQPPTVRAVKGWLHVWLFGLLLAEAVLTGVAYVFYQEPMSVFSMIAFLSGAIVCVVALSRQGETNLPEPVRTVTKVALAYYILKCVVGFIYTIVFAVRSPGKPVITGLEMIGEPGFTETALGFGILAALLGVIGFIFMLAHFRRPAEPPPQ